MGQYPKTSEDPIITDYLNTLLLKLSLVAPEYARVFSYRTAVHVLPEINAVSLSGGAILVTAGLLAKAPSEDFLVETLAHEMGHAALRHGSAMETREQLYAFEDTLVSFEYYSPRLQSSNEKRKEALGLLMKDINERLEGLTQFRVKQETEADFFAARVMLKAGFNPRSVVESYLKNPAHGRGYVDWGDHPPNRIRRELLECEMKEHPPQREEMRPPEFLAAQKRAQELLEE
ncbi:MAG: M48 family metalloprotease [Patescibacteria group bacterium]